MYESRKGDIMFNSKYSKVLTVVLVIAIILIIALIAYFSYDIYRKYYTNKGASDAVDQFQDGYVNKIPNKNNTNNTNDENIVINGIDISPNNNTNNSGTSTAVKEKYQGFTMVGTIEISKINLKYPILEGVSTKALDTAVCLQYGKLNQIGNSVVIGHNYRNGTFFSNLYKLSNGDKITISDYTGKKITYTIYDKFEAEPEDVSFYTRDTNGARELTLSTCTDDSSKRTIIFAKEK